jgi:hypothetical protein
MSKYSHLKKTLCQTRPRPRPRSLLREHAAVAMPSRPVVAAVNIGQNGQCCALGSPALNSLLLAVTLLFPAFLYYTRLTPIHTMLYSPLAPLWWLLEEKTRKCKT